TGAILSLSGVLLFFGRTRAWGALLAGLFIGFWVLGLHVPRVFANPTDLQRWLGLAECLAMSTGALLLFRGKGDGFGQVCVILFGAACLVFGLSHFVYAQFTASMIPAWLPRRLELAYLTGAIHTLMGLALLIGRWRRWAAGIEAAMMTSFVFLVHAPRVFAHPTDRMELTLLFVAITLSSAAWSLAASRAVD
ncbi:MAG: DoxX family membrane protein, partial [Phenylobacterium sp.]